MNIINGESLLEEINVDDLDLSNHSLKGKFIVESNEELLAFYITDNDYCAYGYITNLSIQKDCALLDVSIPVIEESGIAFLSSTNSITVVLNDSSAYDLESGINRLLLNLYSNDKIVSTLEVNNIEDYVFSNLTTDTEYTIEVVVINGNNLENSFRKTIKTKKIDAPTYVVEPSGWSTSKTITINFPGDFTNEYSIDGGKTWLEYSVPILLNENGSIISRISDGYNYIVGNSQIISKIDSTMPSITITGNIESNTWTNKEVVLTANVIPSSTISGYTYEWYRNDIKIEEVDTNTYTVSSGSLSSDDYTVKVITGAANTSLSSSYTVLIDKILPTITINPDGGNYELITSSKDISTIISSNDVNSGIKEILYALSNSNTVTPTNFISYNNNAKVEFTLTGPNKYLWVKSIDNAGNNNIICSKAYSSLYSINYDTNGGTGTVNSQSKKYNVDLQLSSVVPTRDNYEFKGWSTTNDNTVDYSSGDTYTTNESITLYAVWELLLTEETVTLSFPSTTTQTRTLSKELEGFNSLVSVNVNNGSVSYTMSGNTINVTVSGGTATSKQQCENRYICEDRTLCSTTCWSCSESPTGTCCGCYGCWPNGTCCCAPQTTCGWQNFCSYYNYYEYVVTIKYMKGT